MNNLTIKQINIGGQAVPVVDSREVAEMVDVRHDDLLKKIRGYKSIIDEGFEDSEKLPSQKFFIDDTYTNSQNKIQPCFQLTRKGCDMVANKMNGKKGVLFTAEYVTKFEEMEEYIKGQAKLLTTEEMLELQFKYAKEVKKEVKELKEDFKDLKDNLPLLGVDCDEITGLIKKVCTKITGYETPAYKDKSLRGRVYSDIYGQVRREFQVKSYKAIKRSQIELAKEIIRSYKAPTALLDEIIKLNNQMNFEEVI